jgi:hypothetical protein
LYRVCIEFVLHLVQTLYKQNPLITQTSYQQLLKVKAQK